MSDEAPDWREIEESARRCLEAAGFASCVLTKAGPDGGVDVRGPGIVAQVKAQAAPVTLAVVQRTYGCAQAESAVAVVFGSSGFSRSAVEWANQFGVALFGFSATRQPVAMNGVARDLRGSTNRAKAAFDSIDPFPQMGTPRFRMGRNEVELCTRMFRQLGMDDTIPEVLLSPVADN